MYKIMIYDRKDDSEYNIEICQTFNDARSRIEMLKRFVIMYSDNVRKFDDLYFYVQDSDGNSVY